MNLNSPFKARSHQAVVQKVKAAGADASFDNRASSDEQASEIQKITGGKFSRVFDASTQAEDAAMRILDKSTAKGKFFAVPETL